MTARRFRGRTVRGVEAEVHVGPCIPTQRVCVSVIGADGIAEMAASAFLTRRQARQLVAALEAWLASTEGAS